MKKFKVNYSGFAYVEAETAEEACEAFAQDDVVYEEHGIGEVEEVDEFNVEFEATSVTN